MTATVLRRSRACLDARTRRLKPFAFLVKLQVAPRKLGDTAYLLRG